MVKNSLHKKVFVVLSTFLLVGCGKLPDTNGYQGIGTIGGAGAGMAVSQSIRFGGHTASGQVAGTLIGAHLGYNLLGVFIGDGAKYPRRAFIRAVEYNPKSVTTNWKNPWNYNSGSFTPVQTFQRPDGTYCRKVLETMVVNGRIYGNKVIACRIEREKWQIIAQE